MSTTKTASTKKFANMKEFFASAQFKKFEKNSIAKLVEIVKEFDLYPNPTVNDFKDGYSYRINSSNEDGLDLRSVNLAPRQSVKLVSGLVLDNFGLMRLNEWVVKNEKNGKRVQTVHFPGHWSYRHYGGGSNGCGLFDASFDLNGKLIALHMQYETDELAQARQELDDAEMSGNLVKSQKARENHKKVRAALMTRVDKLIDPDNLHKALENKNLTQERA